ncbi:MAG TPA: phytoene/squalene synthase family protein [Methylibium sp.]|uniref:phytoene/squalene synthase family protein n=1 Tax=Methylibium sp. TaxID=2067992 RepID=UPI002DBA3E1B|nr:phytoene/squalene synthase family protein [Methylibium sp.]HEU4457696.1 phytoene/squalene synthase family protein [Methylibium sp.]
MTAMSYAQAARSWDEPATHAADLAACRDTLRGGSRTFLAASHLLPAAVRDPACALYAFCRLADDAVDRIDPAVADPIAVLRHRLAAIYAGQPADAAADRAFAVVVRRHGIPRGWPEALIEGFEWDRAGRRYRNEAELLDYAMRVAGTVGAMMAAVMGATRGGRSAEAVARACELGCAMQLSNIARDVGEDARMGRLYLPLDWLAEAGIDAEAWLARPVFTPRLAQVIERLLQRADALYACAAEGVALLPVACRPGIHAARVLYAEIGQQVRRNGLDAVSRRAVVRPARKLGCLGGLLAPRRRARLGAGVALPATAALLEMLAQAPRPPEAPRPTVHLIDLFEQLEHRRIERRSLQLR